MLVFMFTREVIRAILGNADRSDFHHFVIPGLHVNRTAEAERDVLGGAMVVILTAVVVLVMRLILAN